MNRLSLSVVPAALALLLAGFAGRGTRIAFAPAEGLVLVKRGSVSLELTTVDLSRWNNGEKARGKLPDESRLTEGRLVVTDTYGATREERVRRLTRTFEEATQHERSKGKQGAVDEETESPLAGLTVVFTRREGDGAGEDYTVAFGTDDAGADEDLLVGLEQSLDFDALLPKTEGGDAGELDEGDSWSVDVSVLRSLLANGGDLKFVGEQKEPAEQALIGEALRSLDEGAVTAAFRGMRAVDGRELAVLAVVIAAAGDAHGEEIDEEAEMKVERRFVRDAHVALDLEGELLWDVQAGHFARFAVAGELRATVDELGSVQLHGEAFEQRLLTTFSGQLSMEITAEAE